MSGSVRGAREQSFAPTRQGRQRRRAEKSIAHAAGAEHDIAAPDGDRAQERFLKRQLVLPVSTISQW